MGRPHDESLSSIPHIFIWDQKPDYWLGGPYFARFESACSFENQARLNGWVAFCGIIIGGQYENGTRLSGFRAFDLSDFKELLMLRNYSALRLASIGCYSKFGA